MLKDSARKYKQLTVLAVASAAIAAYVTPFDAGTMGQTQTQLSLYEKLHENLNSMQDDIDDGIQDLRDQFEGVPRALERLDDAQNTADQRIEKANERVNEALQSEDKLQTDSVDRENEEAFKTESQSVGSENTDESGIDSSSDNNYRNEDNSYNERERMADEIRDRVQ